MDEIHYHPSVGDKFAESKAVDEEETSENVTEKITKSSNPARQTVTNFSKFMCSPCSDEGVPCYQVGRSSNRFSNISEDQESVLPISPVSTPPSVKTQGDFQSFSVPTLGAIMKKNGVHSHEESMDSSVLLLESKSTNVFDELGMMDKDISWVTTMETPAHQAAPSEKFNTIERATLLPDDSVNMQPRALFSPIKNGDCDCMPLHYSSENEEEPASNNPFEKQNRCEILVHSQCAIDNKETCQKGVIETRKSICDKIDDDLGETGGRLISLSPVFSIKRNKKLKKRKKRAVSVKSPNALVEVTVTDVVKDDVGCDKTTEGYIVCDMGSTTNRRAVEPESVICEKEKLLFNEPSPSIQDDSFQDISFSCIDELCKSSTCGNELSASTAGNEPRELNKENRFETRTEDINNYNNSSLVNRRANTFFYYNSEKRGTLHPVSAVDHFLKSAKRLDEGIPVSSQKPFSPIFNQGLTVFTDMMKDFCEKTGSLADGKASAKRLRQESLCNSPAYQQKKKVMKLSDGRESKLGMLNSEADASLDERQADSFKETDNNFALDCKFAITDSQMCTTADYAENSALSDRQGSSKVVSSDMTSGGYCTGSDFKLINNSNNVKESDKWHCPQSFSTASGKSISVSSDALRKIRNIFADELEGESNKFISSVGLCGGEGGKEAPQPVRTPSDSFTKAVDLGVDSTKNVLADISMDDRGVVSGKPCGFSGFTTASGSVVKISEESLAKAKMVLGDSCEGGTGEDGAAVPNAGNSLSFGFKTASNKPVRVSKDSLQKVKAIWAGEDVGGDLAEVLETDEKDGNNIGNAIRLDVQNPKGNTDNIFEECCDPVKPFFGFNTASGKSIKVSESALTKARKILRDSEVAAGGDNTSESCKFYKDGKAEHQDGPNPFGEGEIKNLGIVKQGSSSEKDSAVGRDLVPDDSSDNSEAVPKWIHTYNTSPTLTMDRMGLDAVTSREDCRPYSTPREGYIIKSPVLGETDRFFSNRKRRNRGRKLVFTSSPPSLTGDDDANKQIDRGEKLKKCYTELNLDFGVPFKRKRTCDLQMTEGSAPHETGKMKKDVIEGRRKARFEQQKSAGRGNVKPCKGSLMLMKEKPRIGWSQVGDGHPDTYPEEVLTALGVREDVLRVSDLNAVEYKFTASHFYRDSEIDNAVGFPAGDGCFLIFSDDNTAGVGEVARAFLAASGVQPNLISEEWVRNHYRWIVSKLCHYERSFPRVFAGACLTPNNVFLQLKYRYDREIDLGHRSALKKIFEHDEPASRRMVLRVFDVKKFADVEGKVADSDCLRNIVSYKLGVTDGWYGCYAQTDAAMSKMIESKKVTVGTKIITQRAELLNCERGISPLEVTDNINLKIFTNSTRRVRWDAKLGFQKYGGPFPICAHTILPQGGHIGRIDVIIVRTYPMLYMEKKPDGTHVTRNRRAEDKVVATFQQQQEEMIEKIYQQVKDEMQRREIENMKTWKKLSMIDLPKVTDGEELYRFYETCSDPSTFQSLATIEQKNILMDYQRKREEVAQKELSTAVRERIKREKVNGRKVSEFVRIKIVDLHKPDYRNPVVLTVWNSPDEALRMLTEGKAVSVFNLTSSNSRSVRSLQLNSTRQTQYIELPRSVNYPERKLVRLSELTVDLDPLFGEIDCTGIVVMIQETNYASRLSQTIFIADSDRNFAGIVFWGTCKDLCWENILTLNSIIACSNLQWNKNRNFHKVPSLYVMDHTVFTENPKHPYLKAEIERLKAALAQETDDFVSKCAEEITKRLEEQRNSFNHGHNSSCADVSGGNTPASLKPKYINGFKMRPNASSTPCKPFPLGLDTSDQEPSPIQKRIEKLQLYGEPPPLSPLLPMDNLDKFKSKFKVPYKNTSSV